LMLKQNKILNVSRLLRLVDFDFAEWLLKPYSIEIFFSWI
jgi:hypothetical protein